MREYDDKLNKIDESTDSSTVFRRLKSAHKSEKVFVANRIAEVLESSSMDHWRQAKGTEKPANFSTGVVSNKGLEEFEWLSWLARLQEDEETWPKPLCQENKFDSELAISAVATDTKAKQSFGQYH